MKKTDDSDTKKKTSQIFFLNGTSSLHLRRIVTISKNGKDIDSYVKEETTYHLRKVTKEQLFELRLSPKPGFVLKINDEYFYTRIPKDSSFISQHLLGKHLCSSCQRLSSSADCNGGCAKVRDLSQYFYVRRCFNIYESLKKAKRIEKYDFIEKGYEAFNTRSDAFVVLSCKQYHLAK